MIEARTLPTVSHPHMQEISELSSFLDDVFTGNTSSVSVACKDTSSVLMNAPQSLPDIPVLPSHTKSDDFFTQGSDWMDKEIEAIISSSPATSEEAQNIHQVSPSVSPQPVKSAFQIPETLSNVLSLNRPAPSPLKRKTMSRKVSLVSDGSDSEDNTSRPAKRARSYSVHSSEFSRPDDVISTFDPNSASLQKLVAPKSAASKPKSVDVATKKKIRREKNREHAKKSRSKKRDFNLALEESVVALREENQKLRKLVYAHFGEEKAKAMVKERIRTPEDKMIEAMKKPASKVLTKSVVHYLESLRCDINLHARR